MHPRVHYCSGISLSRSEWKTERPSIDPPALANHPSLLAAECRCSAELFTILRNSIAFVSLIESYQNSTVLSVRNTIESKLNATLFWVRHCREQHTPGHYYYCRCCCCYHHQTTVDILVRPIALLCVYLLNDSFGMPSVCFDLSDRVVAVNLVASHVMLSAVQWCPVAHCCHVHCRTVFFFQSLIFKLNQTIQ